LNAGQSPLELRHYQLIEALLHKENNGEELMLHLPHQLRMVYVRDTVVFEHPVGTDLSRPPNPTDHREYTRQPISRHGHFQNPGIGFADAGHPRGMKGSGGRDESVPTGVLPIPGRVVVPGTPWTAVAEIVPGGEVQHMKQAILSGHEALQRESVTQYAVHIDADCVGDTLLVRRRKPGDRIRPLGMAKEKKVQDILVDKHIARSERMLIPLFFSQSHCVWLAGVCLDDRVRLTEATERIVRLSILTT
jgi:tRNA(Ile)-lysidine synthase